jgi:putative ABC transport system permease protein
MRGISNWTLARRSVAFYFRSHLGTIAGAAIATAVLTGALLVGDSVRGSLRAMALARLGKIETALASGDRLFRSALAQDLQRELGAPGNVPASLRPFDAVAALQVMGSANTPDGSARANQVQVIGVDDHFWKLANKSPGALAEGSVFVNDRLARQLQARSGDTILLRLPRVSHLSRDAPLAAEEDATAALRLELKRIVTDDEFGRFGLAASQLPPLNAFVPLSVLQRSVNATNQANLLLLSGASAGPAQAALTRAIQIQDMQLLIRPLTNPPSLELRSPRVFLDAAVSEVALKAGGNPQPAFTYFVNQLRLGDRVTPYSMVSGTTMLPLAADEIALNQWAADDLQAKPGDEIAVTYYVMGLVRELIERTNTFRVRQVVPMELPYTDPGLMPDFPGMTDAENCRDWDTGFPIQTDAIRDRDEAYWDQYKGAPKAFISLKAAQNLWNNRFGNLTAVRYSETNAAVIANAIKANLKPEQLGFIFLPVREQALAASSGAQDFGGLFIGFSFFLIAAALLLMLLLFRFALEQRGAEVGTLLAIGFRPRHVSRLLVLEGLGLAVIGSILGVGLAVLYAKAMLYGLSTIWSEAVAGASLTYHGRAATLAIGLGAGIVVAVATIWWSLRTEAKRSARELLNAVLETEAAGAAKPPGLLAWTTGTVLLLLGASLAAWGLIERDQARPDLFFGAGALILVAGLVLVSAFIRKLEFSSWSEGLSLTAMGVRSITRRRKRSRAAVALLACGSFLIASIGAFRLDAGSKADARNSGTGGFALIGESSIAIPQNLNAPAGREFFGLSSGDLTNVQFVPFRVLEGEDASCLNLNRAQRPRLLGVNAQHLAPRAAFTFTKTVEGRARLLPSSDRPNAPIARTSSVASPHPRSENPWNLLDADFGPDIVPAIGDAASIQWALGKKVGDDLIYLDATGREFKVRIVGAVANSILQGNLLISETNFIARFPSQSGYRMFLIDAPSERAGKLAETLSQALQDVGLSVVSARERLAAFNAVQNTYLGTFQMLGGLGLLLGSFGLGVILLRNIYERRSEFALLLAVGFRKPALRWLILSEHAALLVLGLFVGVVAAAIAILPSVLRPGTELPYAQIALTLGAVFVFGLLCTLLAARRALRVPLLSALRNE